MSSKQRTYVYTRYYDGDRLYKLDGGRKEDPEHITIESWCMVENDNLPMFKVRDDKGKAYSVTKRYLDKYYALEPGRQLTEIEREAIIYKPIEPKKTCGTCMKYKQHICNFRKSTDDICDEYIYTQELRKW